MLVDAVVHGWASLDVIVDFVVQGWELVEVDGSKEEANETRQVTG